MTSNSRNGPVELVTVPALGAEWKKSELEAMTKKGRKKRERGDGHRKENLKAWWRDQRGCCGRWGTRKHIAIGSFIFACMYVSSPSSLLIEKFTFRLSD